MGDERRSGGTKWGVAALLLAGGACGLALANRLSELSAGEARSVLAGEPGRYAWTLGDIHYIVKGKGAPLVLVHGVYAGASSYEFRRIFDLLAQQYRVYAFDLLGFGLSERPPLVYAPVLYEQLIADFVREVVGGADHPVKVIASTLGAAFTIRTAAERPGLFERLVFIEPTGYEELTSATVTPLRRAVLALLRSPLLGQGIYNLIASRPSVRYYLKSQTYADPNAVSDDMVDYYYTMAHQPGARYAVASFLSGMLNTPVGSMYPLLKQPILLCWGKDAKFTPLENARLFRQSNPRAELRVFDCGGLPQDELPAEFLNEVLSWLKSPSPSSRGR